MVNWCNRLQCWDESVLTVSCLWGELPASQCGISDIVDLSQKKNSFINSCWHALQYMGRSVMLAADNVTDKLRYKDVDMIKQTHTYITSD